MRGVRMNYKHDEILDEMETEISEDEISNYDSDMEEDSTDDVSEGDGDKKNKFWKEVFSWVKIVVGAFIVAFLLSNFVIINARVPSGSMISTINKGNKVIGFRLAYLFDDPKRGDIVIFDSPIEDKIYIKRLIGLPGDTIEIKDSTLYINGELIEEDYVEKWTNSPGTTTYEVPKGEYFMMGDNRDYSADSRNGWFVKKDAILAKAIFRYYPSIDMLN